MSRADDDPYELHAQRFLDRLKRVSGDFHSSDAGVDELVREAGRIWPQVLVAFWWASRSRSGTTTASDICQAILACADGDIVQLQSRRTAAEVKHWADALADYAKQLRDSPNDVAFLFRFAGIAKVQAGVLEIAEETQVNVREVLGHLGAAISRDRGTMSSESQMEPSSSGNGSPSAPAGPDTSGDKA